MSYDNGKHAMEISMEERCDACGQQHELRFVSGLMGPAIEYACQNCVGPGIGWFYMPKSDIDAWREQYSEQEMNFITKRER